MLLGSNSGCTLFCPQNCLFKHGKPRVWGQDTVLIFKTAEHPHETGGHEHLRQAAKAWATQFWELNFQALLFIVTYHYCERNLQFINLLYFVLPRPVLERNWNKNHQFKGLGHLPEILFMSKSGFHFFVEEHGDLLVKDLSHSLKIIMHMLY